MELFVEDLIEEVLHEVHERPVRGPREAIVHLESLEQSLLGIAHPRILVQEILVDGLAHRIRHSRMGGRRFEGRYH